MFANKIFGFFGVLFLFLGATIIFNSFQGITGFSVYEEVDIKKGYMIGVWFILTGILLAVYRRKEKVLIKRKR